jgi:hypothetical protein
MQGRRRAPSFSRRRYGDVVQLPPLAGRVFSELRRAGYDTTACDGYSLLRHRRLPPVGSDGRAGRRIASAGRDGHLARPRLGRPIRLSPGRGYAAGVRGYWWGSNRAIGQAGLNCLVAAELADDPAARARYLAAAEEYLHYLNGRNPIGLCFWSNMKSFGAENSVMVMFHSWVGSANSKEGQRYIGEGEGKIGPFPGMVVGGVNGNMKRYVNNLDWRQNPWEFNEPCITYQSSCASLLNYFGLKAR